MKRYQGVWSDIAFMKTDWAIGHACRGEGWEVNFQPSTPFSYMEDRRPFWVAYLTFLGGPPLTSVKSQIVLYDCPDIESAAEALAEHRIGRPILLSIGAIIENV